MKIKSNRPNRNMKIKKQCKKIKYTYNSKDIIHFLVDSKAHEYKTKRKKL